MCTMDTVIELASFIRSAEGILSREDVTGLISHLAAHPESGDVIRGSGGLRKVRWSRPSSGKRGGARVIYYHVKKDGAVYLLLAYAKAAQGNLTTEQLKRLMQAME